MASHVRATMQFAEILSESGQRIYIGAIMAFGRDWVEVSIAPSISLDDVSYLRFVPARPNYSVKASWRKQDRVGFTYLHVAPPEEQFAGMRDLHDPRPASMKVGPSS